MNRSQIEDQFSLVRDSLDDLEGGIIDALDEAEAEAGRLHLEIDELQAQIGDLETANSDLKAEIEKLGAENARLTQQLVELDRLH